MTAMKSDGCVADVVQYHIVNNCIYEKVGYHCCKMLPKYTDTIHAPKKCAKKANYMCALKNVKGTYIKEGDY
uniref:Uncharacterized protein n=1 Tax=Trichogramma kaykai TaxID=54128 RepID=A0ABD2WP91_9HYME